MSPLSSSSSEPTTNTTPNSDANATVTTRLDFMEYFPWEIRLEIYSLFRRTQEPCVYFDDEEEEHRLSRYNLSKEIREAYDRLEPPIEIAAIMNDTEVLHMLLPQITNEIHRYDAARILARHGCLTGLQWYCQQYEIRLRGDLCQCAAFGGHRHILQWILQQDRSVFSARCCQQAAHGGQLKLLQWLHEQGCDWDAETCSYAAWKGHLEVLKYAHEKGCPWNEETCEYAAWSGHLEVLKYAHENGCPWNHWTCTEAATNRHLEVLKYAHENGCPWNEGTFNQSDRHYVEMRSYLREHGCPGSQGIESEDGYYFTVYGEEQDDEIESDENGE